METVTVTIDSAGKTTVDVEGMQGQACSTATHGIELVLGGQNRAKKSPKPEFFMPDVQGQGSTNTERV